MSRWLRFSLALVMLIVIWSASNISWSGNHSSGIIKADGRGYYAHLPALFIYKDLNFSHYDSIESGKYLNSNYTYDYRKYWHGKTYNKYFAGTSLAMAPFFAIGHLLTKISGEDADGYSKWYQISVSLAAITYLFLSLLIFIRVGKLYSIGDNILAWCLPIIVLGTNWYHYVVSEPAMSHVYSVFFISLLVYMGIKWGRGNDRMLLPIAILLGLITFIRPANIISVLIIPVLCESPKLFWRRIKATFSRPEVLFLALVIFLIIPGIQLLIYRIQTGQWFIYSYEDEGFNFLRPHFIDILISYKKGLFLYTPITLISLIGIVFMRKENRWRAYGWLTFFLLLTYVLSSWWNWYYGGSFSSRAYLEYMIVFFVPLSYLIQRISGLSNWKKATAAVIFLFLIGLCQFQTFQYRHMVIHWDGMTREQYWHHFLNPDFLR